MSNTFCRLQFPPSREPVNNSSSVHDNRFIAVGFCGKNNVNDQSTTRFPTVNYLIYGKHKETKINGYKSMKVKV